MSSIPTHSSAAHRADTISRVPRPVDEVYISADVETDGPIPGEYSMLSFALCVAGTFNGQEFLRADFGQTTLYRELRPISDKVDEEALSVNGLDRDRLLLQGDDPVQAMESAYSWVVDTCAGAAPILVAAPLAFDWAFLHWYFVRFARQGSPFGFNRCVDVRSFYQGATGSSFGMSGRGSIPLQLRPKRPHTHHAVDDAIEQAEMFANIFEWAEQRWARLAPTR